MLQKKTGHPKRFIQKKFALMPLCQVALKEPNMNNPQRQLGAGTTIHLQL